jgi:hypothetical protein
MTVKAPSLTARKAPVRRGFCVKAGERAFGSAGNATDVAAERARLF